MLSFAEHRTLRPSPKAALPTCCLEAQFLPVDLLSVSTGAKDRPAYASAPVGPSLCTWPYAAAPVVYSTGAAPKAVQKCARIFGQLSSETVFFAVCSAQSKRRARRANCWRAQGESNPCFRRERALNGVRQRALVSANLLETLDFCA